MKIKRSQIENYLVAKTISTLDKETKLSFINHISSYKKLLVLEELPEIFLVATYSIKEKTRNIVIIPDKDYNELKNKTSIELTIPKSIQNILNLKVSIVGIYNREYDKIDDDAIHYLKLKNANFYKPITITRDSYLQDDLSPLPSPIPGNLKSLIEPGFNNKTQYVDIHFIESKNKVIFNFINIPKASYTINRLEFGKRISKLFEEIDTSVDSCIDDSFGMKLNLTTPITIDQFQKIIVNKRKIIKTETKKMLQANDKLVIRYFFKVIDV